LSLKLGTALWIKSRSRWPRSPVHSRPGFDSRTRNWKFCARPCKSSSSYRKMMSFSVRTQ
jgi:hypothetical protein